MKRSVWIVGGVIVVLLAGAAFVGARMLGLQNLLGGLGSGQRLMLSTDGGETMQSVALEPAAELPDASPDVAGLFARREDNSVFVGTGAVRMLVEDGQAAASSDGPEVEVVVTHETTVYRDVTLLQHTDGPLQGKVQQVLEVGSFEEIDENCIVTAWGEERGGRVLADVLVYSNPLVIQTQQ
jgi:hypothetical protein